MLRMDRNWTRLIAGAIVFSGALAQIAQAQDKQVTPPAKQGDQTPPAKQGDQKPPANGGEQKPEDQKEKPEPREKFNFFTVGYSQHSLSGISSRLEQYASPARGLTLFEANLTSPWSDKSPYGHLVILGTPGEDVVGEGQTAFDNGKIYVRGVLERYGYSEPDWQPHRRSEFELNDYTAHMTLGPDAGAYFRYREENRERGFIAPLDPTNYRAQTSAVGLEGKIFGGQAGLTLVDARFYDHTGQQPNSLRSTVAGHYTLPIGPVVTVNGQASYTKIAQSGLPSSSVRSASVSGVWDIATRTSLSAFVGQDNIDLRNVQNAYVQKRLISSARLDQGWHNGGGAISFTHREDERVRADHDFVDVPKWETFEAKAWHRFGPQLRFTAKGSLQNLNSAPTMETEDPRQLYWSYKSDFEARIEGGNEQTTAYAGMRYRYRKNNDRDFSVAWTNYSIGASRQLRSNLLGYAEFAYDKFDANGVDPDTQQPLAPYFPDALSWAVGADWTRRPGETITGALNYALSRDSRLTQLTLTYHRELVRDQAIDLVLATPWRYDDRQFDITGYRATLYQVRYTTRF